jgi:hypothetical protein
LTPLFYIKLRRSDMARQLYQQLAHRVQAMKNCELSGNTEWLEKHRLAAEKLADEFLPSGSGFDSGSRIDLVDSAGERLVLYTQFHHMNESGMYDGWTEHTIRVYPSLLFEIRLTISGRNRNEIKDLIHEEFHVALTEEVNDEWE